MTLHLATSQRRFHSFQFRENYFFRTMWPYAVGTLADLTRFHVKINFVFLNLNLWSSVYSILNFQSVIFCQLPANHSSHYAFVAAERATQGPQQDPSYRASRMFGQRQGGVCRIPETRCIQVEVSRMFVSFFSRLPHSKIETQNLGQPNPSDKG